MIRQTELNSLHRQALIQRSNLSAPVVIQKVNHRGHTSSPTDDGKGTLHFSILKKVNTYYLRILHYTGSPARKSVTVSLRTSQRYRAVGNADYLKQRLIDGIGGYNDFEDIRFASKAIALSELPQERIEWFATDNRQVVIWSNRGEPPAAAQ